MKLGKHSSALAVVLVLMLASASLVAAQVTPNVYVEPPSQIVYPGDQGTVSIMVSDVSDLYGAQFSLTFGDIGVAAPVSVEAGSAFTQFPDEYEVAQADVVSDTVTFAATLLRVPKAGPISGTLELAVVTFDAIAEGTTAVSIGEVKLSDSSGAPIAFTTTDGSIEVTAVPTTLEGFAYMEARTDHSGILVELSTSPVMTATTDASGAYAFSGMAAGSYTLTMSSGLYLSAMATDVEVIDNQANYACDVTLLGGDLNDDEVIDILDLSLCASHFETTDPAADVNADGTVDVYDLVLLGKNFKLEGPTVVSCAP